MPDEIDIFVPMSTFDCGFSTYQCPKLGFLEQINPGPAACSSSQALYSERGKFLQLQQLCGAQRFVCLVDAESLRHLLQLKVLGVGHSADVHQVRSAGSVVRAPVVDPAEY